MHGRGTTRAIKNEKEIILERAMVTRHYKMRWNLEYCVGCQIGPSICPFDAITHVDAVIEKGRMVQKQAVDIDPEKCVFCGECVEMCPVNVISMTVNGKTENPVINYEAFPKLVQSTVFDRDKFDMKRKDFVIENCSAKVITYDEDADTLVVDDPHCIRCRQCEVASDGAFKVEQPWEGKVELRRDLCVEGCFACADICPTRALHINDKGELVLADYFCIKCGACMQICPIKPEVETYEVEVEAYGVKKTIEHTRITNAEELPIYVERWRVNHTPVVSAAWTSALLRLADDKADQVEIDRKRALKRRDLIIALKGGHEVAGE
ncbi:MAG: 4Fe-4S binding protein [Anaerolineaceae bacterium]|nr:4Fe-4S binding protein [Anaerolineaceae bacterium]